MRFAPPLRKTRRGIPTSQVKGSFSYSSVFSARFREPQQALGSALFVYRMTISGVPSPRSKSARPGTSLSAHSKRFYVLALLLAVIFFAAQLHCCFDLNSGPADSHLCPVCHTVFVALAACAALIAAAGSIERLEILRVQPALLSASSRNIPSRAPPAVC